MQELHALPEGWPQMHYEDLLQARRKLTAAIIRRGTRLGHEDPLPQAAESIVSVGARPRDEVSGVFLDPGQPLLWRRAVPLQPDFELRQGDTVLGEMEPAHMARMDATGECLGRTLELRLETRLFAGVRVKSHTASADEEGPAFRGPFFGWGRVSTTSGEVLRWRHAFSGLNSQVLSDSKGKELLRMRPTFLRFGRSETRVGLTARGWDRPDLGELLLLTWFLRVHIEAGGRRVFKRSRRLTGRDSP